MILLKERDPHGFEILCQCAKQHVGKIKLRGIWDPKSQFNYG
jgi:hypothetical protein